MRLHVGCGPIYLRGWLNVDSQESGAVLAGERPDLIGAVETGDDDYYARLGHVTMESLDAGAPGWPLQAVCDAYGDFDHLPAADGTCSEILARQVFEHLSLREAGRALAEAARVLRPGGLLRLDVPDHDASLAAHRETGRAFFIRHLLGSRKAQWAYHVVGWTRAALVKFCEDRAFAFEGDEPSPHFYPAICLRFRRTGAWLASWQYCGEPLGTPLVAPEGAKVLEVGPGRRPWPRADFYIDADPEMIARLPEDRRALGSVEAMPDGWDSKFDFAFCSHVLEHTDDPALACRELSRVARSGVIVCPSPAVDALFAMHEPSHKWLALWPHDGVLRFLRVTDAWRAAVFDDEMSRAAHRLYRLGSPNLGPDGPIARRWFHKAEPWLDVVHRWRDAIAVECIG